MAKCLADLSESFRCDTLRMSGFETFREAEKPFEAFQSLVFGLRGKMTGHFAEANGVFSMK